MAHPDPNPSPNPSPDPSPSPSPNQVRALAPAWQRAQEINTDLVGLIDAYAVTFVNELDYSREAAATTAFSQAISLYLPIPPHTSLYLPVSPDISATTAFTLLSGDARARPWLGHRARGRPRALVDARAHDQGED